MDAFTHFFDSSGFMPHGHCFIWKPILLWGFVLSDALIAVSYFSISLALWYFARRREDLPFKGLFIMFGMFVMACGATHLVAIWTIWQPSYWFDASVKVVAAAVSVATAIMLWLFMPRALAMLGRGGVGASEPESATRNRIAQASRNKISGSERSFGRDYFPAYL